MRYAPTLLLILAFPAGFLGYAVGAQIMTAIGLPDVLAAFGSLFFASLVMIPFAIPFLDRRAKADLAAHAQHAQQVESGEDAQDD
jgi:hypothetical protein